MARLACTTLEGMGLTIQPSLRSTGEAPGTGIAASHCPAPPYSPARAWDTPARPSAVRTNAPALDPTELHPSQPRRRQRRVLAPATGNTGAWPAGGRCYTTSPVPQAVGGDKQLPSSAGRQPRVRGSSDVGRAGTPRPAARESYMRSDTMPAKPSRPLRDREEAQSSFCGA